MPAETDKQQSAFAVALAARKGKIKEPEKVLRGASLKLFKDKTLSDEQLSDFASGPKPPPQKTFGPRPRSLARRT